MTISKIDKRDKNGHLHCEDGPAYKDDTLEEWRINGVLHRTDGGPALINTYGVTWFQHGLRHRINGPATISRYGFRISFWISGLELGRIEFEQHYMMIHLREYDWHCNRDEIEMYYR